MGWFLSTKKGGKRAAKSKTRSKGKSATAAAGWDPQRTLRIIQIGGWTLGLAAVAAAWYLGEPKLRESISQRRGIPPQVVMHDVPAWMSDRVAHELAAVVYAAVEADPFDQASLQGAAVKLSGSAWVRHVERINRAPGGKIDVHAAYRAPTAIIEHRDGSGIVHGYHLVDRESVRLPVVYRAEHADKLDLPLIRGVHQHPPDAGRTWPGGDLKAGIELAWIVSQQPWADQVQAIDVTNYGGRRFIGEAQLKLLTKLDADDDPRNNAGVAWGRPPGEEQFYEPSTATKLANLQSLLRRYSTIDADGKVVDLFRDVVHIHPLNAAVNYTVAQ